jgi:LysR family transcriptional regulator, hydrogen peroxide-inducible genes activator
MPSFTAKEFDAHCRKLVRELSTFELVVREGRIKDAARHLEVKHQEVTRRINQLRTRLGGVELLERDDSGRNRPTPLGAELMHLATSVTSSLNDFLQIFERWKNPSDVVVGTITSVWAAEHEALSARFKRRIPDGSLIPRFFSSSEQIEPEVRAGRVDAGIITYPVRQIGKSIDYRPWHDEELCLVASAANMRFANVSKARGAHFLEHSCFIFLESSFRMTQEITKYLKRHKVKLGRTIELRSIAEIKDMTANDIGISILPEPSVRKECSLGQLRAIPLANPLYRPVGILYRRDSMHRPVIRTFISCFD